TLTSFPFGATARTKAACRATLERARGVPRGARRRVPYAFTTVRARCMIDVVRRVLPSVEVLRVFVRSVAVGAAIAALGAGCTTPPAREPSRDDVVLDRLLPSAVQIVLESPEGRRFRTGSGVVIASRPRGQGSECFVLTSGHTVADTKGQKAIYLLFGRERGAG